MSIRTPEKLSRPSSPSDPTLYEIKTGSTPLFRVHLHFNNISYLALLDTGAGISVISSLIFGNLPVDLVEECKPDNITIRNACGTEMSILGKHNLTFRLDNKVEITHPVIVTNWLAENLILGMNFISRYQVVVNAINKSISYRINGKTGYAVAALEISLPGGMETNVEVKVSQLDPQQTCQLKNLLIKHRSIFAEKITELGSAKNFEHRIITTGPPISFRPHRGISTLKPVIKQHVDELLKCGIIRKSRSPYAAGIVMVCKPKDNSWRVCIDYRR